MPDTSDNPGNRRSGSHSRNKGRIRPLALIRNLFRFTMYATVTGAVAFAIMLLYLRSQALPAVTVTQTSQLFDLHGEVIDTFHSGQNREVIPLSRMAKAYIDAVLAIEDRNFYNHLGLDPKGIARAILQNIKTASINQGASTITQQLARNLYLNHDRNWSRKLKEAVYALHLEMHLSKDQILEQYLNTIYFGNSTYGVQAASRMFFGKNAWELSLAEAAMLAGIPKGPRYYSPYWNMENAKARQKIVLQAMVEQGFITEGEAQAAAMEELHILPPPQKEPSEAPYFRDYVRHVAIEELGISEELYDAGGLRIYTTLDLRAQRIAEDVIEKTLPENSTLQVALIAIDPRNGYIKAMVGGRDYTENQYNRVLATTRQPGSSFKPFLYLAALKEHVSPLTKYMSAPTIFTYDEGRKTYSPSNYGNKYFNEPIDMRQAIRTSDNIYAVSLLMEIGVEKVIETARQLGITAPLDAVPSLALGSSPVSPFQMAYAYGVLANQGKRAKPIAILRIEDHTGKVLYEATPEVVQAVEPAYAYVLTHMLQSVFEPGGTAHRVSGTIKRPVAGKTGTTNNDAWMVGYTPELSVAVWLGHDQGQNIGIVEQYLAAPIFAEFIERTLEPIPPKLFPIPEGVVSAYIDPVTGKLANESCPNGRMEVFIAGTEPTDYCAESAGTSNQIKQPAPEETKRSWWQDLKRWWNE